VFRTNAKYAPFIRDLTKQRPVRLSRAQVETLAIIAYRQPVTRPEIDDVRGVDSGPVLKVLLERDLVRILGKRDEVGRPLIYGTTNGFLEFFGLGSLKDLPTLQEFTELNDESREKYEDEMGELPNEAARRATHEQGDPMTSESGFYGHGASGESSSAASRSTEDEMTSEGRAEDVEEADEELHSAPPGDEDEEEEDEEDDDEDDDEEDDDDEDEDDEEEDDEDEEEDDEEEEDEEEDDEDDDDDDDEDEFEDPDDDFDDDDDDDDFEDDDE